MGCLWGCHTDFLFLDGVRQIRRICGLVAGPTLPGNGVIDGVNAWLEHVGVRMVRMLRIS